MKRTVLFSGRPKHRNVRVRNFTGKRIKNTRRVERVLNLIKYLNNFRTIKEIAAYLEVHNKSVNRYLNLLVQLGFTVEVSHGKRHSYRIKDAWLHFV